MSEQSFPLLAMSHIRQPPKDNVAHPAQPLQHLWNVHRPHLEPLAPGWRHEARNHRIQIT
jgi:hypothetical protein